MSIIRATALNVLRRPFANAPRLFPVAQHSFVHPRPPIFRFGNPCLNFSSTRPTRGIHYVRFGGDPEPGKRPWGGHRIEWIIGIGVFGVGYYVSHLEQVPETGRWRFMNISRKFEEKIGKMTREEILQEHGHKILSPNHIVSRHVQRVVSQILSASNLGHIRGSSSSSTSDFVPGQSWGVDDHEAMWDPYAQKQNASQSETQREWEVMVVNERNIVNAMTTPGLIVVFTGILPVCKDERGLAAVLAHEIGHVVARHTAETISARSVYLALLTLVGFMGMNIFGLPDLAHYFLLELPHSRTMEYEADKIGLTLMSRACYDPQGAVEMFDRLHRLESDGSSSKADFFHTHPSGAKRVEELSRLLPEAYEVLNASPDCAGIQDRLDAFRRWNVRNGRLDVS